MNRGFTLEHEEIGHTVPAFLPAHSCFVLGVNANLLVSLCHSSFGWMGRGGYSIQVVHHLEKNFDGGLETAQCMVLLE